MVKFHNSYQVKKNCDNCYLQLNIVKHISVQEKQIQINKKDTVVKRNKQRVIQRLTSKNRSYPRVIFLT